jgi:hypothetical protein
MRVGPLRAVTSAGQGSDWKLAVRPYAEQSEPEVIGALCFSAKMAASGQDHFQRRIALIRLQDFCQSLQILDQ